MLTSARKLLVVRSGAVAWEGGTGLVQRAGMS
jgi:hypothetical protein